MSTTETNSTPTIGEQYRALVAVHADAQRSYDEASRRHTTVVETLLLLLEETPAGHALWARAMEIAEREADHVVEAAEALDWFADRAAELARLV